VTPPGDRGQPMIALAGVSKRYGGAPAVDRLTLEVAEGEVMVLVGPSGCGKTTTMKMVNRLVEPDEGSVLLAGRDVREVDPSELRRGIGYVIQEVGLFPHLTVEANVATVPRLLGWPKPRIRARVEAMLELVGLPAAQFRDRMPSALSGGQRQRVGVARALAADPPILLMDEPFGAVDPIARDRLQEEFLRLQQEVRKTVVFVTHDVDEAIRLGDRVTVLNVGGRLEQTDPPVDLLARPANDFVRAFLGADRELKRLGLIPLASVPFPRGPREPAGAVPRGPREPAGAVPRGPREPAGAVPGVESHVSVELGANARSALDAMLAAGATEAAVVEGGRTVGMVRLEDLAALRAPAGTRDTP
jgi:osmoprotectant transport system ATP-binding protein